MVIVIKQNDMVIHFWPKVWNTAYIIEPALLALHFPSPRGAESAEIMRASPDLSRLQFTSQAPQEPKVLKRCVYDQI